MARLGVAVGAESVAPHLVPLAVAGRAPAAQVPWGAGAARQVHLLSRPGDQVDALGGEVELGTVGEGVAGRGHEHQLLGRRVPQDDHAHK